MPKVLSARRQEAFSNLKLDNAFFEKALQRLDDPEADDEEAMDYDLYLMEKSVMPLLLQGLEALARHMDKATTAGGSSHAKVPFNPLTWLAQYMLRNHPKVVNDHRSPMYHQFTELALAERGRRTLVRRRAQMEEVWLKMEKGFKATRKEQMRMTAADVPEYIRQLDECWCLEGMFQKKLPQLPTDYSSVQHDGMDFLLFEHFWQWFEAYIAEHDVVRAQAFAEAEEKRAESERKAQQLMEEKERRERTILEVHEIRRSLEESFDALSVDVYTNDGLGLMLNKGYTLELPDPSEVKPREGTVPIVGEHVSLLLCLLDLWGCPLPDGSLEDQWSDAAVQAWLEWQRHNAPEGLERGRALDGAGLRAMLSRDAYQDYLMTSNKVNIDAEMLNIVDHQVEISKLVGETEDTLDFLVEALDEETGEILQLSLPEAHIEQVRLRLSEQGGEPVLARVDLVSGRVKQLLQPNNDLDTV
jgi:hypothetical protein